MAVITSIINGVPGDSIDAADRGLSYGHGLFETMRLDGGVLPLWSYHCERLLNGARRLRIPLDADSLESARDKALAQLPGPGMIKLTLTAGPGPRGYGARSTCPGIIWQWFEVSAPESPVILQCCEYRLPANPPLAGIKHLNRLDQVMAAMEAAEGHQPLLLDTRGNLVEALSHNLFLFREGRWWTPALNECGVEGVMRELLLVRLIPECGEQVEVATLPFDALPEAEEVFICNSVSGLLPVVGEQRSGAVWPNGERTRRLQYALQGGFPCFGTGDGPKCYQ